MSGDFVELQANLSRSSEPPKKRPKLSKKVTSSSKGIPHLI